MGSRSQNLIQLLKIRGFINQRSLTLNDKTVLVHHYGAPGTLMRHNIKRQWWKAMVLLQSNVFPIEVSPPQLGNLLSGRTGNPTEKNLQNECRDRYTDVLTLANSRLPFSISSVGECLCPDAADAVNRDDSNVEKTFFLQHAVTTEMLLQNYIPPSGVSRIFDYWLQIRLAWWKKFSRNPSKFRVISTPNQTDEQHKDCVINSNNGQNMSIVYDFSWGPETLEHVHNIGDEDLKRLQEERGTSHVAKTSGTSKNVLPHCIECTASLEMGMAAFLVDAYHERKTLTTKTKSRAQTIPLFQIHPNLSPFHVALVITTGQSATTSKELCHVCGQLERDLKAVGVSVFNASEHVGTLAAHFKRNDQLGIPYTLILNENTLTDGVLNSRDRDTEIKKPVHVSKVVEEINRNVKATLD